MTYKILEQWGVENPRTKSSLRVIYIYVPDTDRCYYCLGYYNEALTPEQNQTKIINTLRFEEKEFVGVLQVLTDMTNKHQLRKKK